jgi:hypothetical protein
MQLNNNILISIIGLLFIFYLDSIKNLPKLLNNIMFKFLLCYIVIYINTKNVILSIISAILFITVSQIIINNNIINKLNEENNIKISSKIPPKIPPKTVTIIPTPTIIQSQSHYDTIVPSNNISCNIVPSNVPSNIVSSNVPFKLNNAYLLHTDHMTNVISDDIIPDNIIPDNIVPIINPKIKSNIPESMHPVLSSTYAPILSQEEMHINKINILEPMTPIISSHINKSELLSDLIDIPIPVSNSLSLHAPILSQEEIHINEINIPEPMTPIISSHINKSELLTDFIDIPIPASNSLSLHAPILSQEIHINKSELLSDFINIPAQNSLLSPITSNQLLNNDIDNQLLNNDIDNQTLTILTGTNDTFKNLIYIINNINNILVSLNKSTNEPIKINITDLHNFMNNFINIFKNMISSLNSSDPILEYLKQSLNNTITILININKNTISLLNNLDNILLNNLLNYFDDLILIFHQLNNITDKKNMISITIVTNKLDNFIFSLHTIINTIKEYNYISHIPPLIIKFNSLTTILTLLNNTNTNLEFNIMHSSIITPPNLDKSINIYNNIQKLFNKLSNYKLNEKNNNIISNSKQKLDNYFELLSNSDNKLFLLLEIKKEEHILNNLLKLEEMIHNNILDTNKNNIMNYRNLIIELLLKLKNDNTIESLYELIHADTLIKIILINEYEFEYNTKNIDILNKLHKQTSKLNIINNINDLKNKFINNNDNIINESLEKEEYKLRELLELEVNEELKYKKLNNYTKSNSLLGYTDNKYEMLYDLMDDALNEQFKLQDIYNKNIEIDTDNEIKLDIIGYDNIYNHYLID